MFGLFDSMLSVPAISTVGYVRCEINSTYTPYSYFFGLHHVGRMSGVRGSITLTDIIITILDKIDFKKSPM